MVQCGEVDVNVVCGITDAVWYGCSVAYCDVVWYDVVRGIMCSGFA